MAGVSQVAHADWIDFLNENDGAVPEPNESDVGKDNGVGVTAFFSVKAAQAAYRDYSGRMPPDVLPIADAVGGNLVCLGLSASRTGVLFWDHETEELTALAPSFRSFLASLRRIDPSEKLLRPGQVQEVVVTDLGAKLLRQQAERKAAAAAADAQADKED